MRLFLKRLFGYSYYSAYRFFSDKLTYRASALAFTTLLAIVPFITVIVFFVALFPAFSNSVYLAEGYLLKHFIPSSSTEIQFYLQAFIKQTSKLPTISLAFLFITAMLLVNTIEETLNDIWEVKVSRAPGFALLLYWGVLILTPVIVGLSVFLTRYFVSLAWVQGASQQLGITSLWFTLIPLFINTLMFSLLYIIVPNAYVTVKEGFAGGFIAAILFEISRAIFVYYLQKFPSYALIYGTFATVPVFLVWLYICWFIILFGALFAYEIARDRYDMQPVI